MKISLDDQIQQRPLAPKKGNLWFIEIFQKKWDELNLSKLSLAVWQRAHAQKVHLEMRLSQSGVTPRPANTQETPPIQPSYSIHITSLFPQRPQPAKRNIRRGLGKRKLCRNSVWIWSVGRMNLTKPVKNPSNPAKRGFKKKKKNDIDICS